jgi:hypothetical protein
MIAVPFRNSRGALQVQDIVSRFGTGLELCMRRNEILRKVAEAAASIAASRQSHGAG